MRRFTLIFVLSTQGVVLLGRQLYWLPTIGDWDNTANWSLTSGGSSCGCTPANGDTTHINIVGAISTVPNGVIAKASRINIGFNATLRVGTSYGSAASLSVADSEVGLDITGTLQVYGLMNVNRMTTTGIFIRSGGTCAVEAGATIDVRPGIGTTDTLIHNEGDLNIDTDPVHGVGKLILQHAMHIALLNTGDMATVSNSGIIDIDSTLTDTSICISNQFSSVFGNHATLNIRGGNGLGLVIDESAIFSNSANGELSFSELTNLGIYLGGGNLFNEGVISCSDGSSCLNLQRSFINEGTINCSNSSGSAISANARMINDGEINIVNCVTGIHQYTNRLINSGDIFITDVVIGIYMVEASDSLSNEGQIEIHTAQLGLHLGCNFANFGTCTILECTDGLSLDHFELINYGSLEASHSMENKTTIAINTGTLINMCNAELRASSIMSMESDGQLQNQGAMHLNLSSMVNNGGTILNDGIISDFQDALATMFIPGDGILLRPLHGRHVLDVPSHGIIEGSLANFTMGSELYYDADLTVPAGTYFSTQNSWIPAIPAGLNIIYHDIFNGCTSFTMAQPLESPVLSQCPIALTNSVVEDGTWDSHRRWSLQQIPTFCHDVQIEPGRTVVITSAEVAQARTIEVQENGFFEVYGELEIDRN